MTYKKLNKKQLNWIYLRYEYAYGRYIVLISFDLNALGNIISAFEQPLFPRP